jgi:hypothetical protein
MSMPSFTRQEIQEVFTPSLLSGFICISAPILVMTISVLIQHFDGNDLNQEIGAFHSVTSGAVMTYQSVATNLSQNQIINNLPLYLFWGGVGCIVYLFTIRIILAFSKVVDFEHEMNYVNTRRKPLIIEAAVRGVVRLVALTLWVIILLLTLHHLLPYNLLEARNLAATLTKRSIVDAVFVTILLMVDFGIQTIILRLLALKPRVF